MVDEVLVKPGQRVKKGAVLLRRRAGKAQARSCRHASRHLAGNRLAARKRPRGRRQAGGISRLDAGARAGRV
ncbi:MAG: hypothetical protein M1449_13550 [Candidatus Thermoplasmatota archaeon]|nr:hypothetical protein [Candidatus Thermoplasmatota archaeon]